MTYFKDNNYAEQLYFRHQVVNKHSSSTNHKHKSQTKEGAPWSGTQNGPHPLPIPLYFRGQGCFFHVLLGNTTLVPKTYKIPKSHIFRLGGRGGGIVGWCFQLLFLSPKIPSLIFWAEVGRRFFNYCPESKADKIPKFHLYACVGGGEGLKNGVLTLFPVFMPPTVAVANTIWFP